MIVSCTCPILSISIKCIAFRNRLDKIYHWTLSAPNMVLNENNHNQPSLFPSLLADCKREKNTSYITTKPDAKSFVSFQICYENTFFIWTIFYRSKYGPLKSSIETFIRTNNHLNSNLFSFTLNEAFDSKNFN